MAMPEPMVPAPRIGDALQRARHGTVQRRVLGAVALGEELVAQREGFARDAQALEQRAFVGQAVVDVDRGRRP